MRLGQFCVSETDPSSPQCGVVLPDQDAVVLVQEAGAGTGLELPRGTDAMLAEWGWREKVTLAVEFARETDIGVYDRSDLVQRAPVTVPPKVICIGMNYMGHVEETDSAIPDEPTIASKFSNAIVGPDAPIEWDPELTQMVDYGTELVIVIGDRARNVSVEEARAYVAGYTIGNDVVARDLQRKDGQWERGKSLDTFAPLGPEIVTPDEIDGPDDLNLWTVLDGDCLQDSNTSDMVFDTDSLVAYCSEMLTLVPGDVIYTGTPSDTGTYLDPPRLLEDGATITVGVEHIGELTNPCRHRSPS